MPYAHAVFAGTPSNSPLQFPQASVVPTEAQTGEGGCTGGTGVGNGILLSPNPVTHLRDRPVVRWRKSAVPVGSLTRGGGREARIVCRPQAHLWP